jgi:hypothetical protein
LCCGVAHVLIYTLKLAAVHHYFLLSAVGKIPTTISSTEKGQ